MSEENKKPGMIVLLIFLLICSGLGIAAFTMSFTKKCGEGFYKNDPGLINDCSKEDVLCINSYGKNHIPDYKGKYHNAKASDACKLKYEGEKCTALECENEDGQYKCPK